MSRIPLFVKIYTNQSKIKQIKKDSLTKFEQVNRYTYTQS